MEVQGMWADVAKGGSCEVDRENRGKFWASVAI